MGLLGALRGGVIVEGTASALIASFQGDATIKGILALTAVASAVVTPLTLYRQDYSFSVGFSLSVAAMGLALLNIFGDTLLGTNGAALSKSFAPLLLVSSMIFHGIRLGSFFVLREIAVPSKHEQIKSFDKTSLLNRLPFSIAVGFLYAFMVTPALFLCRASAQGVLSFKADKVTALGAALAWLGAVIEAISDLQKFVAKRGKDKSKFFQGPTTGWFGVSRHPSFFGEILFWLGILVGGTPGLQINILAWIVSLLGFYAIYNIMIRATVRLEKKQREKYGRQPDYEKWKKKVPQLFPGTSAIIFPLSVSAVSATVLMKAVQWLVAAAPAA